MTSLTFFGGANEIGGNKILLEDKDARVYLDFGEGFNFGEEFFFEYLQPRNANGLEVYFEFGLMPQVSKLYGKQSLERTALKYETPDVDAVFISHSHSDHAGHLPFLDESIPVYLGHGTHKLLEIYHKLFPQFCDIGEHENLNLFKSGDKIKVKHLVIEPIHVDHSIPGAYGFIIHTSIGPIVYSGDLRLHGPESAMTKEFVEKAAASKPFALLLEGTRMGGVGDDDTTEKGVEEKLDAIIQQSKGLVFGYFSMSNLDRFKSFYNATVKNKRKLVIDTQLAYLLDEMREKIPSLPDVMTDDNILVYYRLSSKGTHDAKDYYVYERKFMPKMVTFKEVKKNQGKFVMQMSFNKLIELIYLQPKKADYVYSSSAHFLTGEANEGERTVLENWMRHFKVKFHKAHCSGHASKIDLEKIVKEINPNVLIPIHTTNAEGFKAFHDNVLKPEKMKKIELK